MTDPNSQQAAQAEGTQTASLPAELQVDSAKVFGVLPELPATPESITQAGVVGAPVDAWAFASHVHSYVRDYIASADQKAAFVFAVGSALLVYSYGEELHHDWLTPLKDWGASDGASLAAMVLLFAGVIFAAAVVAPRLAKSHKGLVFFLSVAEFSSSADYASSVTHETAPALTQAILEHSYDLALVARRKFKALGFAIWSTAFGSGILLARLLLAKGLPN